MLGTDPFLPESKGTTLECLQLLDSRAISNIVGLTTKFGLLERDIELLESFRNIKVVILVSYTALPEKIEPFPAKRRLDTLRLLSASLPYPITASTKRDLVPKLVILIMSTPVLPPV